MVNAQTAGQKAGRLVSYSMRPVFDQSADWRSDEEKQRCVIQSFQPSIRSGGFWERHWFEADSKLRGLEFEVHRSKRMISMFGASLSERAACLCVSLRAGGMLLSFSSSRWLVADELVPLSILVQADSELH